MELTYHWEGDYLIPDLEAPENPKVGKYGMLRRDYLRNHRKTDYDLMWIRGTLNAHLEEIDRQAKEMVDRMVSDMAKAEGVNEALKARDQMAWVGAINNIRDRAEEIVYRELIYI